MDSTDQGSLGQGSAHSELGFGDDINTLLQAACKSSGRSLDFWAGFTQGLDDKSVALLAERAHMIPEDMPTSWEALQKDQREVATLFSQMESSDRKTMLEALRTLVDLRATH